MKKFFQEFKTFIARGNVLDMAIGVIVGGAFGKIVTSLVNDMIMPLLAWAMGGNTVQSLCVVLNGVPQFLEDGTLNPAAICWNYGNFIQTVLDFLIISFCVFLMLKLVMKAKELGKDTAQELRDRLAGKDPDSEAYLEAQEKEAAEAVAEEQSAPAAPAPTDTELLTEIRDLLRTMQPPAEKTEAK